MPFHFPFAIVISAVVAASCAGCGKTPGISFVGGGGSASSDGWWFLSGSTYFRSDEPGVVFGMQKTPEGTREFSYVILFKHANKSGRNVEHSENARVTFDGKTAEMRHGLKIDGKAFNLALDLEADKEAGKVQMRSLKIDGKEVDPAQGTVFLVDFTSAGMTYEQIHAALPADLPDPTDDTKVVEKLARDVIQKLKSENDRAKKFLEP